MTSGSSSAGRMPVGENRESEAGAERRPPRLGGHSALCPTACAAAPCALRLINVADNHSHDAAITVWVETVVVWFLIGEHLRCPRGPSSSR